MYSLVMGTRSDSDTRPNIVDPAGLVNPGDREIVNDVC